MTLAFIIIITLSFIYTLYLQLLSTSSRKVRFLSDKLKWATLVGAVGCAAALIIYYGAVRALDNEELSAAIGDAFAVYALPACIFSAIVILLTVCVCFTGKKTALIVPSVCHLASLLVLLYSLIFASWSHYEEFALNMFVELLGCSLSFLMMPAASLYMARHAKRLDDKDYVAARRKRYEQRLRKAEEKQRIKETKNRIKNKTKR